MKYPLDKQFRAVSHLHLPLQKWMAVPSQLMLRALPCRSDKDTEVQRMMVVGPDVNRIPTLIIRPRGVSGVLPCLYDIHGGGFVFAAAPYHYTLRRNMPRASAARSSSRTTVSRRSTHIPPRRRTASRSGAGCCTMRAFCRSIRRGSPSGATARAAISPPPSRSWRATGAKSCPASRC